jgi:hypothetical protein
MGRRRSVIAKKKIAKKKIGGAGAPADKINSEIRERESQRELNTGASFEPGAVAIDRLAPGMIIDVVMVAPNITLLHPAPALW